MSIAATNEQLALQAAIRDWAKRAGTRPMVRAREPGHTPAGTAETAGRYWEELANLGVFAIALPEHAGGAGGTVSDLAAALEELTLALAPGPVLPAVLAGLALAPAAGSASARGFLTALADGTKTATLILPTEQAPASVVAGHLVAERRPDGGLLVNGETGPVLSGGPGARILASAAIPDGAAWFLVPDDHPGIAVTERNPVDFSRPLATVRFTDAVIAPEQLVPEITTGRVTALAATLFSVEAAAVARWCSETAAEYARTRHQFGRPIGSFQAVKHLCATMLCRAEEAAALAWDAARAAGEPQAGEPQNEAPGEALDKAPGKAPGEFSLVAAAAAAKALDAAVANAKDCVQVLGGIGFTWEHDAHLYLRRALALRQLLGGGAKWRERTAELALEGARRQLSLDSDDPAADEQPDNRPNLVIGIWAGHAVAKFGTEEQRDRFLRPTTRGEITWCQLFSEPEAGSDLAGLRTRAVAADGGWLLTGQKVWTSLAREADWAICLARTDPDVPKHKGLTFFLVDMKSGGLDIRPLREMTGRALFNEVFLDGVFVPDDRVLGQPGEGWRVARATLAAERVAMGRGSSFGEEAESLIAQVRSAGLTADRRVLERVGGLISGALAGSLLDFRRELSRLSGTDNGDSAAIRKLLGVSHRQDVAEAALDLCGAEGAASDGIAAGPAGEFLLSRCLSIAGGTTQILLSVVAERVLGLPREEAR